MAPHSTEAVGTPLFVEKGLDTFPQAAVGTLDPRNAMAETVKAFLESACFLRGGGDATDTEFNLNDVALEWPDPSKELRYPTASIIDAGEVPYQAHALTPTALEETWGEFDKESGDPKCTVLWKTAEAVADFQVDFWTIDTPTREAIAARIPSLFNPSEGAIGVVLAGDPRYFHRTVRATLMNNQRMDTETTVYENERRLRTLVRCEIDVVHLRNAVELLPKVRLVDGVEGE